MARPQRNTVDYFPHLIGDGKKMFFIEQKYGNDGYSTWYKILEKLGSTENHYLNLNKEEEVMYLAAKCLISEDRLISIINDLARLGAFNKELWDNKIIWCQSFIDNIQDAYKKRSLKCISIEGLRSLLLGYGILKVAETGINSGIKPYSIVEDSIVKESKGEDTIFNEKKNEKFFLRIKNEMILCKVSEYIINRLPEFLDVWKMQNGNTYIDKTFHKIDVDYNTFDFKDENHIKNTFKLIYNDFKSGKITPQQPPSKKSREIK